MAPTYRSIGEEFLSEYLKCDRGSRIQLRIPEIRKKKCTAQPLFLFLSVSFLSYVCAAFVSEAGHAG